MNLDNNPANDPWRNGDTDAYLMNLDNNPANDPWRNGMTDYQLMNIINAPVMAAAPPEDDELMNLITLKGAKDLYGKAKGTGLFNLEQDLELQNLIKLGKVGKIAGKAGKAYLTKGLFQNLDQQPFVHNDPWKNDGDFIYLGDCSLGPC